MGGKEKEKQNDLVTAVVNGMEDGKAADIVVMDLREIKTSICDYYIICHGNSTTQAESVARKVHERVSKDRAELPWHTEGFQNSTWILLDYVDVVVHVFEKEHRAFYNIEELWADAELIYMNSGDEKAFGAPNASTL